MRKICDSDDLLLKKITNKASLLAELTPKISRQLPADLANACQVANFEHGTLTLTVPNNAWATRLRYATPDLQQQLRANEALHNLRNIEIIICQPIALKPQPSMRSRLSQSAQQTLTEAARKIGDSHLAAALLRLAGR